MVGLPGSGKSTRAAQLALELGNTTICSADSFFINTEGEYVFNRDKLGSAHMQCQRMAEVALAAGHNVIIDNTNVRQRDRSIYVDLGNRFNIAVEYAVIGEFTDEFAQVAFGRCTHNVPLESILAMANAYRSNPIEATYAK